MAMSIIPLRVLLSGTPAKHFSQATFGNWLTIEGGNSSWSERDLVESQECTWDGNVCVVF